MAGARTTCLIWQVPVGGTQFTYTGMPVRLVAPVHRWCALLLSKLPLITIKTSADYHQNFRRWLPKLALITMRSQRLADAALPCCCETFISANISAICAAGTCSTAP